MNLLKDSDNYGERRRCGQSQCHTARDKRTASSSSLRDKLQRKLDLR